jgi:D-glycero-alpha-D-manno-heptose-7-phosphate kinase
MLFFTGISRFASEIAKTQIEQTRNKSAELSQMHDMVKQAVDILNGNSSLEDFGRLLHDSWMLKRNLTSKITSSSIDAVYQKALDAGAYGGKLLGAGGGGFMLIFASPDKQPAIREKLAGILEIPFRMEFDGSRIIYCAQ